GFEDAELGRVAIGADNGVADFGEAAAGDQAHVTRANDGNFQFVSRGMAGCSAVARLAALQRAFRAAVTIYQTGGRELRRMRAELRGKLRAEIWRLVVESADAGETASLR